MQVIEKIVSYRVNCKPEISFKMEKCDSPKRHYTGSDNRNMSAKYL